MRDLLTPAASKGVGLLDGSPQLIAADVYDRTYVQHALPMVYRGDRLVPLTDYLADMEARLMAAITGAKPTT